MIQERILELVKYGLTTGLVDPADEVYTVNRLLEVLGVDDIQKLIVNYYQCFLTIRSV